MIQRILLIFITLGMISCSSLRTDVKKSQTIDFQVNLNDRSNDTFKVTIAMEGLTEANAVFQFAATAPGTYKVMDIGRFVSNFKAYDVNDKELQTQKIATNQYQLSSPQNTVKITYEIAETFDSNIKENTIYLMCGTSIEEDHALINGQAVFGYFKGMQTSPIRIRIAYPTDWKVGTALSQDPEGRYLASSYDQLVDSPFLMGNLSQASSTVGTTDISVYTFSQNNVVHSEEILTSMKDMLLAADEFVYGLPVDKYTFLYYFDDTDAGAWEHSYSSEYILREQPWEIIEEFVKNTAAHEFFHIITPLNIHSEIIERFNFVEPVPSRHLWLYEATTEWAANTMLYRSGQTPLPDYLDLLHSKADADSFYDASYSLEDLALKSYTEAGQQQYANIYSRGALIMGLLDIKLLSLSNGERGLREVVHELTEKYGPRKPFDEAGFYEEIVHMTYPEIRTFINNYIKGTKPLPFAEYYAMIGIDYKGEVKDESKGETGMRYYLTAEGFVILQCSNEASEAGFKEEDIVKTINGMPFTLDTVDSFKENWAKSPPGTSYTASIVRDGKTLEINSILFPKVSQHVFMLDPNPTVEQKMLFEKWSRM